jgi:hypothetical protein
MHVTYSRSGNRPEIAETDVHIIAIGSEHRFNDTVQLVGRCAGRITRNSGHAARSDSRSREHNIDAGAVVGHSRCRIV